MGYKKSSFSTGIGLGTAHSAINNNNDSARLPTSQIMQGGATAMHGMAEIIVQTAKDVDDTNKSATPKDINSKLSYGVKHFVITGTVISGWGAINDGIDAYDQYKDGGRDSLGNIKVSTTLSFAGNALGAVAGIETVGHNKKKGVMFDLECVNEDIFQYST